MKSHIINVSPLVLSCGLSDAEKKKLDEIAKEAGVSHKAVGCDCGNEKIGYLCGFRGYSKATESATVADGKVCLIFSSIPKQSFTRLLSMLKSGGIIIPLKAIVTPTNQGWTLNDLIAELEREHEMMKGQNGQQ